MSESFAEDLTANGVVVLRGVLQRDVLQTFVDSIQPLYVEQDSKEEKQGTYGDGMLHIDQMPASILDPFKAEVDALVASKFGELPRTQGASQTRRVAPRRGVDGGPVWSNHTGWHLDAEYFHCDHHFTANFWIPLSDGVNVTKAGVSFIKMSQKRAIELTGYVYDPENVDRDRFGRTTRFKRYITDLVDGSKRKPDFFTPALDMGDVAVFSNWCPHASSTSSSYVDTRFSMEWRQCFETFSLADSDSVSTWEAA